MAFTLRSIHRLRTSPAVEPPSRAVFHASPFHTSPARFSCSAPRLQPPATSKRFSPPACHQAFFGRSFYDYYGLFLPPSNPSRPRYRLRLGLPSAVVAPARIRRPSPGKLVDSIIAHLPSYTSRRYEEDHRILVVPGTSSTPGRLPKGSLTLLRWPLWLQLPSDPSLAERVPLVPSSGSTAQFLRAPLPSPTRSLLPRAETGIPPASRRACRSQWVTASPNPAYIG